MKILHYINNLGSGGAEKLLTDILPIISNKNQVDLVISNSKANVIEFEEKIRNSGIPIVNFNTSFYNPLQVFFLLRLIHKNKYDIVHAHLFPSQYWLAFASFFISSKTKIIKTEHSIFNERKKIIFLKPLEIFVYRRFNKIIGITDDVSKNLIKWLGSNKNIVTIYNGVNLEEIALSIHKNSGDYSFLNKNQFNILMVGRFDGIHKDQLTLIKALPFLPSNTMLFFAGEGPALDTIKQQTKTLGFENNVTFLGLRNDVYKLMSLVDLNVLSTNTEGLSGVALESLAAGKPFIGSNVDGVKNIVPNANYLFEAQNSKELSAKINTIKNDTALQKYMVEEALQHVKKFDITIMVSHYIALYNEVLKR